MSMGRFAASTGLVAVAIGLAAAANVPPVVIDVRSPWGATSPESEASELLAAESAGLFWEFVDQFDLSADADVTARKVSLGTFANAKLPSLVADIFKAELEARAASAAVEAIRKISRDRAAAVLPANSPPACKDVFFEAGERVGCTPEELATVVDSASSGSTVLTIDHVYPSTSNNDAPTVILYGAVGSASFKSCHAVAKAAAESGKIQYVFRHYESDENLEAIKLPGWGVELDVKKMDYKAVDDAKIEAEDGGVDEEEKPLDGFDFKKLRARFPEKLEQLSELKSHLVGMRASIRPMKVWELQDIGIQAASRIMRSSDPVGTLQHVSQNFPVLASSLISEEVDSAMLDEVRQNQEELGKLGLEPGGSLFTLNSRILEPLSTDLFSLLDLLRSDAKLLAGLQNIGFPQDTIATVTGFNSESSGSDSPLLDTRVPQVMFMNDLETDKQYKRWSKNIMDLLRPAWPGQPRYIARNIHTAVFVVDPTSAYGMQTLLSARQIIKDELPVRIGFLFTSGEITGVSTGRRYEFTKEGVVQSSDGDTSDAGASENKVAIALMRAFSYVQKEESTADAFGLLESLAKWAISTENAITIKKIKGLLVKNYGEDGEKVLRKTKYGKILKKSNKAISDFGIRPESSAPLLFINGMQYKVTDTSPEALSELLSAAADEGLQTIQRALYYGMMKQTESVYDFVLDQKDVVKRLNPLVSRFTGPVVSFDEQSTQTLQSIDYAEQMPDSAKPITALIVGDFDTNQTRLVAFEALRRQLWDKKSRIAFVHSGADSVSTRTLYGVMESLAPAKALQTSGAVLAKLLNGESSDDALKNVLTKESRAKVEAAAAGDRVSAKLSDHISLSLKIGVPVGQTAVVVNGRVIGPFGESDTLTVLDFKNVEKKFASGAAGQLFNLVKSLQLPDATAKTKSDMIMFAQALITPPPSNDADARPQRRLNSKHIAPIKSESSAIILGNSESVDSISHEVLAVLDPLSKEAQHLVPVLRYMAQISNVNVKIILNPKEKISEKPLNRFYRTVLPDVGGQKHAAAIFDDLPTAPVLTVGMHVPPAWLVQAKNSPYDLDNIQLESAPKGVFAEFALEYLMLEGRCYEDGTSPAAGLQLELGTETEGAQFDTIVMANLGYFQLKARPGAWQLRIRKGRSADIYSFSEVIGSEPTSNIASPTLILNKFSGKSTHVEVVRNPGKENTKLLVAEGENEEEDNDEETGLWGSLNSLMGSQKKQKTVESAVAKVDRSGETINIFSLASGHLYERFLKLMMLSVLKNTKNPVKFWFLKNCMSPQMMEFLPYMAAEYGFEYQLVQYKWPAWLNIPPTRHRQIWGYKILFLDVLFPLDVKKIIFVDADQVVRADMKELIEFDLEGAPYGYTPFCSDRKEMDGFRFWNSGYWKGHLNGRPYHISALYVVDLIRFRKLAAGDRLREQYQGLSRDPNSLSNLDQDLPNNMVHQVPIKSLPQEWLWCETWCSNDIKPKAKTIDLCNNPLTKEPKLEAAVRIVSEWRDLDYEAKNVTAVAEEMIENGVAPGTRRINRGTHAKEEL